MRGGFAVLAVLAIAACVGAQQNQASAPFLDTQLVSNVSARPALGSLSCCTWYLLCNQLSIFRYIWCGDLHCCPYLLIASGSEIDLVQRYLGASAEQQLFALQLALAAR